MVAGFGVYLWLKSDWNNRERYSLETPLEIQRSGGFLILERNWPPITQMTQMTQINKNNLFGIDPSDPCDRWPIKVTPVVDTLSADLLTPLAVYLKLSANSKYSFLLESVEGGNNLARYSFIGRAIHQLQRISHPRVGKDVHKR